MDPHYIPFFRHVYALCWPWLWWNLVRLTAWRLKTGRQVFVQVDRFGNVYVRYIGDAPKPDDLYTYEPPAVPRWETQAARTSLPVCVPAGVSMNLSTVFPVLWTGSELFMDTFHPPKAPP